MRYLSLIVILILSSSIPSYSQFRTDFGISVGASNYLGEIGGGAGTRKDFVTDMKIESTRWSIGGFYRHKISPTFSVKGTLNYIRLTGDDANTTNPSRRARNLNFRNDIIEVAGITELHIYKINDVGGTGRYSTAFNLYLFAGVGLFYNNPKGQTPGGDWVSLQPLQTEGVSYSKFNFAIPTGIGFHYTVDRKYRLGMEIGWRTTFTDYIDDISTVFVSHDDPLTASLANKVDQEIINQIHLENPDLNDGSPQVTTFQPGKKRGDDSNNDSYLTVSFNFSWIIFGKSRYYKERNTWLRSKNKRLTRKSKF